MMVIKSVEEVEVLRKSSLLVSKTLAEIAKQRTTLVIAHRLSTIVDADNILVIENGRLTQKGKHDSLMQENGLYKEMWKKQRKYEVTDKRDKS